MISFDSYFLQIMKGNYLYMASVQNISRHMFLIDTSQSRSLQQISLKNLADVTQSMLLRLQNYDFTIKYCPGEELLVADTFSRYSPKDPQDISVNHVYINAEKK